jgi:hypothetical protein
LLTSRTPLSRRHGAGGVGIQWRLTRQASELPWPIIGEGQA